MRGRNFKSIEELINYLNWKNKAKLEINASIDRLIREFIENPFLHRVERSIHCELFSILKERRLFSGTHSMLGAKTQLIHKEWPEHIPRPEKGNRRGNFDLCVLSPDSISQSPLTEFRKGKIKPDFAIEVGLDYDLKHLKNDSSKLLNSQIESGYLIHLVRHGVNDNFQAVEKYILGCKWNTSYARITKSGGYVKFINDSTIEPI